MKFEYKAKAFTSYGVGSVELTKQINFLAEDGWTLDKHTTVLSYGRSSQGEECFTHFLTFRQQKS